MGTNDSTHWDFITKSHNMRYMSSFLLRMAHHGPDANVWCDRCNQSLNEIDGFSDNERDYCVDCFTELRFQFVERQMPRRAPIHIGGGAVAHPMMTAAKRGGSEEGAAASSKRQYPKKGG